MNKPAPKEPSMDEILSSIRQIIADDDATVAPRKPPIPAAVAAGAAPAPMPRPIPNLPPMSRTPDPEAEPEPLSLTAEQMVEEDDDEPVTPLSFADMVGKVEPEAEADEPVLVDPEDVAFEGDDKPMPPVFATPMAASSIQPRTPFTPRPTPSVARAAPMPDPTLSRDMAEQLVAPVAEGAVKSAFARLSSMSPVVQGVTLDALMRDMLRPMLKEWLDENLPTLVERMVEKEISRISRGGE